MRITLIVLALVAVTACGGHGGTTASKTDPVIGVWTLQTYNGKPLPFTGTPDGDAINQVTGGEMEFNASSYTLGISIIRTVGGTQAFNQNYSEFGTYTRTSEGLALKPFDAPSLPSKLPTVPATISGTTLSFVQDGRPLTFMKR
jgi:hypothetical protein